MVFVAGFYISLRGGLAVIRSYKQRQLRSLLKVVVPALKTVSG